MVVKKMLVQTSRTSAGSLLWALVLLCACGPSGEIAPVAGHATTTSAFADTVPGPGSVTGSVTATPSASSALRSPATAAGADRWASVLNGLNRTRSRALQQMRLALLGRVYLRGTPVLRRERALLTSYRDRGVALLGARLRTARVRVVSRTPRLLILRVVERLGPTTAVLRHGQQVLLPADAPTRRRLRLVSTSAGWRIAAATRLAG